MTSWKSWKSWKSHLLFLDFLVPGGMPGFSRDAGNAGAEMTGGEWKGRAKAGGAGAGA